MQIVSKAIFSSGLSYTVALIFWLFGTFSIVIEELLNQIHMRQDHTTATISSESQFVHGVTAMYNIVIANKEEHEQRERQ
jgi:hypothetical protein